MGGEGIPTIEMLDLIQADSWVVLLEDEKVNRAGACVTALCNDKLIVFGSYNRDNDGYVLDCSNKSVSPILGGSGDFRF
jgi:hypothetical protein